jgi:hypothetical protein
MMSFIGTKVDSHWQAFVAACSGCALSMSVGEENRRCRANAKLRAAIYKMAIL